MSSAALEKVLSCPNLPSLPAVAIELLQLTRDPEVELADIADVVQHDPALTSKILKTVNSSYYGLTRPCPTIKRALAYLGLSTVRSLVLGFSLVDLSRSCDKQFDLIDYWRRCLYSAAAARRIALVTEACDPDEVFTAALMQDIGMLAMHAALGSDYHDVIRETNGNHFLLPRVETESLGFTHAEAGAQLGQRWHLPEQLVTPILYHHRGALFGSGHNATVHAVMLAYRISNLVTADDPQPVLAVVDAMSQALFHLSLDDEREALAKIAQDTQELSALLEVDIGRLPDVEAIMAAADNARAILGDAHASALQPTEAHMHVEPGDRKQFEKDLSAWFRHARKQREAIGLILVEADGTASIGERLGPRAAEDVARHLDERLESGVAAAGTVYRLGDRNFAVLAPGASRGDSARIAERLRRAIGLHPARLTSGNTKTEYLPITATLGVAAVEPEDADQVRRPATLEQLAGKALHAAREAGRNCVRVFTPKAA